MSIEKKDFPVGRRGYDPEAVDSHLRGIAEEVEELRRSTSRSDTLAGVASARVQTIVDAAEQSAAEIRRQAEEDARAIRDEIDQTVQRERDAAAREAERERTEALQQSREYVAHVSEAAAQLRSRLEAMEAEVGALADALRTGGNRLTAELEVIESGMLDLSAVAAGTAAPPEAVEVTLSDVGELDDEVSLSEPKTAAELEPDPELEPESELEAEPELEPDPMTVETQQAELAWDAPPASSAADDRDLTSEAADGDETEGARLIALNMALNGTPREETDRYLAENFELSDRGRLLDEVYTSVEG